MNEEKTPSIWNSAGCLAWLLWVIGIILTVTSCNSLGWSYLFNMNKDATTLQTDALWSIAGTLSGIAALLLGSVLAICNILIKTRKK